jgi:hypothetical protein
VEINSIAFFFFTEDNLKEIVEQGMAVAVFEKKIISIR